MVKQGNKELKIPEITLIQQELAKAFKDEDFKQPTSSSDYQADENTERMFAYCYLAYKNGIMIGDDKGNFNPDGYVTRAEIVTMLDRILQ